MNIFAKFEQHIKKRVEEVDFKIENAIDISRVVVEPPRDAAHGDLATNAAMVLTKQLGMPPRQVAEMIVAALNDEEEFASVSVAGPGFINIKLTQQFWATHLDTIVHEKENYGRSMLGNGQKINVEYVSANPTGPMHVGHCRGAVVGDALANLLEFAGFEVTREYYVNDAGGQIDVLAQSVFFALSRSLGRGYRSDPGGAISWRLSCAGWSGAGSRTRS